MEEAIARMMESLQKIQEDNQEVKSSNAQIIQRLDKLETENTEEKATVHVKPENQQAGGSGMTQVVVQGAAKEKSLSLTFGDDESPMALKLFVEHYNLAKNQNMRKNVEGWQEKGFRANELRFQLRGRAAAWVLQESAMQSDWVKDDEEIIKKLLERYLGTMSVELNIISFEDLRQHEGESLSEYMTRCQEKGYQAFSDFGPKGVQQRIVWKFLSGIRDADVRKEVIKEKWMVSSSESKGFAEVLKIAETAKLTKVAVVATGGKGNETGKIGAAARVEERRNAHRPYRSNGGRNAGRTAHSSGESTSSGATSGRNSSGSSKRGSAESDQGNVGTNFLCHYCKERTHYGGWKMCERRRKENPNWKPDF
jgi:hypothetical protein